MFVLFSSTSSILGSAGQANYAAANGVLNALAQWRHAHALPATAVAWGAWAQVGMAANLGEAAAARWSRLGIGLLSPDAGLQLLDAAIASDAPLTVAMRMNKVRFGNRAGPAVRSLLGAPAAAPTDEQPEPDVDVLAQLRSAAEGDRGALVKDFVRREVARVLGFKPAAMDVDTPLREFGFDSLMAVQVRTRVEADLRVTLPMMSVLRGPSIEELAETILTAVTAALGRPESEMGAAEDAVEWEEGAL
jgi:acyl carrier protein